MEDNHTKTVPRPVIGGHHISRVDDVYAARELVDRALEDAGCIDPRAIWPRVLQALIDELPGWAVTVALRTAGLTDQQLNLRSDNKSGHAGVDWHRGRWRARVWKGGKVVFSRSSIDKQRVIDARAQYLRSNPCS